MVTLSLVFSPQLRALWGRGAQLYWQRRCAQYVPAPGRAVPVDGTARVPAPLAGLIARSPSVQFGLGGTDPVIFLGQLRTSGGLERLVVVELDDFEWRVGMVSLNVSVLEKATLRTPLRNTWEGAYLRDVVPTGRAARVVRRRAGSTTGPARSPSSRSATAPAATNAITLFEGRVDPADPSMAIIGYLSGTERGALVIQLVTQPPKPNEPVRLRVDLRRATLDPAAR